LVVVTGLEFDCEPEFEFAFEPEVDPELVVTTGLDTDEEPDCEPETEPEVDPEFVVTIGFDCAAAPEEESEVAPEPDVAWDSAAVPDIIANMAAAAKSFFISVCPIS
jgi:hypothetical protein